MHAMLTQIQAHRLSSPDLTQTPIITTTPDDAFYILKIVLSRLLSTGNAEIVAKASSQLQEVMDKDYAFVIKKKLDEVYRGGNVSGSAAVREREMRQSFIVRNRMRSFTICILTNTHLLTDPSE